MFPKEYWSDTETLVAFIPSHSPPKNIKPTAVKALIFKNDQLLLTKVPRGWDFPGGHIEQRETPEEALVREVIEETGIDLISYKMIGYLQLTKMKENELNFKYPTIAAIVIFISNNFTTRQDYDYSQYEANTSKFVPINQLGKFHHNWTALKPELLRYALTLNS